MLPMVWWNNLTGRQKEKVTEYYQNLVLPDPRCGSIGGEHVANKWWNELTDKEKRAILKRKSVLEGYAKARSKATRHQIANGGLRKYTYYHSTTLSRATEIKTSKRFTQGTLVRSKRLATKYAKRTIGSQKHVWESNILCPVLVQMTVDRNLGSRRHRPQSVSERNRCNSSEQRKNNPNQATLNAFL
jgi:hypothetical protein